MCNWIQKIPVLSTMQEGNKYSGSFTLHQALPVQDNNVSHCNHFYIQILDINGLSHESMLA
jgi:hypothetical protein